MLRGRCSQGPVLAHGRVGPYLHRGGPVLAHDVNVYCAVLCALDSMLFLPGSEPIPLGFPCGALAILIGDPKDFHWIPHWISELVPLVCKLHCTWIALISSLGCHVISIRSLCTPLPFHTSPLGRHYEHHSIAVGPPQALPRIPSGLLRIHMSWAAGWSVKLGRNPFGEKRLLENALFAFVFAFMCGFRMEVCRCVAPVLESRCLKTPRGARPGIHTMRFAVDTRVVNMMHVLKA